MDYTTSLRGATRACPPATAARVYLGRDTVFSTLSDATPLSARDVTVYLSQCSIWTLTLQHVDTLDNHVNVIHVFEERRVRVLPSLHACVHLGRDTVFNGCAQHSGMCVLMTRGEYTIPCTGHDGVFIFIQ